MLADRLRALGHEVVLTREPGGSPGAEEIRSLVLEGDPDRWSAETELLLFTAARRDHLERTIEPALAAGKVVICDRFADSTRMYQGLSRGDLRGLVDQLHRPDDRARTGHDRADRHGPGNGFVARQRPTGHRRAVRGFRPLDLQKQMRAGFWRWLMSFRTGFA